MAGEKESKQMGSEPRKPAGEDQGPVAGRPHMPGYGIPKTKKGLLPWSYVSERMEQARAYWVCTVSPEGHPHATPVDGIWLDDRLYFGGSPQTRRNRNLAANQAVCIHLDDSMDVVILHGEAEELRAPEPSLAVRLSEASARKYGYATKPEDFGESGSFVFRPQVIFAWKQALKDATRWVFPEEE
jgi:nitroimidazol reductase NimA-like FMN-containing flavoprotein (pyridoxamine 5'-phosphate oxidase superfamily)